MTERFDNAPAAGGSASAHGQSAKDLNPNGDDNRLSGGWFGHFQKSEPIRKMSKGAHAGGCHQSERDDTHILLGIIGPVAEPHIGRAAELEFSESAIDRNRAPIAQNK